MLAREGTEFASLIRSVALKGAELHPWRETGCNRDSRGNHSMEILIQSALQGAKGFGSSLHIRYAERNGQPVEDSGSSGNGKEVDLAGEAGRVRKTSYVIIHKPYMYLEPVVRSMFEEAEDVKVIVDRRIRERRSDLASFRRTNRRQQRDRRQALPMLDVLINVDS